MSEVMVHEVSCEFRGFVVAVEAMVPSAGHFAEELLVCSRRSSRRDMVGEDMLGKEVCRHELAATEDMTFAIEEALFVAQAPFADVRALVRGCGTFG